jgi:hypothetical protein
MPGGFLVRVYKHGQLSEFSLWVAATETSDEALEAIHSKLPTNGGAQSEIGVLKEKVSAETVKRLRLAEGQVWHL